MIWNEKGRGISFEREFEHRGDSRGEIQKLAFMKPMRFLESDERFNHAVLTSTFTYEFRI